MRLSVFQWLELGLFLIPMLVGRSLNRTRDPSLPRGSGRPSPEEEALGLQSGDLALAPKLSGKWKDLAKKANAMYPNVPIPLILAVIHATSRGNPKAVGVHGEEGLFQLTDEEQDRFGVADPFNPWDSIEGGTEYFSVLIPYYKENLRRAIIAYEWGVTRTDKALQEKKTPPKGILEFADRVLTLQSLYQKTQ